ncbi:hypothetical protein JB92DRAFT_2833980 [Gautieria morchelliformis]|nr:hypothetical protein JB92DRAFT_2833980 [Gautieria morchelliformis]
MAPTKAMYLFDSLESKVPRTSRKVHIRRLVDILQLSIHQRDWPRAKRAWSILSRCPEFEWKNLWQTGLLLIQCTDNAAELRGGKTLEYLRVMMLQSPENRVSILQEIILWLIKSDRHRDALEELELYLPSFPYQENAVLHIYAGLLCLFLAHPKHLGEESNVDEHAMSLPMNQAYVRDCETHLRRAAELDPEHPVPSEILLKLSLSNMESQENEIDSDDAADVNHDNAARPSKRQR